MNEMKIIINHNLLNICHPVWRFRTLSSRYSGGWSMGAGDAQDTDASSGANYDFFFFFFFFFSHQVLWFFFLLTNAVDLFSSDIYFKFERNVKMVHGCVFLLQSKHFYLPEVETHAFYLPEVKTIFYLIFAVKLLLDSLCRGPMYIFRKWTEYPFFCS